MSNDLDEDMNDDELGQDISDDNEPILQVRSDIINQSYGPKIRSELASRDPYIESDLASHSRDPCLQTDRASYANVRQPQQEASDVSIFSSKLGKRTNT